MTRSESSAGGASRKQRPTASKLHQQHLRRQADPVVRPSPPAPLRKPGQRGANADRSSQPPARRSPELKGSSERRHGDHYKPDNGRGQRSFLEEQPSRGGFLQPLSNRHQLPSPPLLPSARQLTDYERERRREDQRRLSGDPPRDFEALRRGTPIPAAGLASESTRQSIHQENRAIELTRLNSVVVQRNNTIAEGQRKIAELKDEIFRLKVDAVNRMESPLSFGARDASLGLREELENLRLSHASKMEMAVAMHDICARQHGFLRAIGGIIFADDAAKRLQFDAWIHSNEFYLAHVKKVIAFETNWDEVARKANADAMKEIAGAAQHAAQHAAQRASERMAEQVDLQSSCQSGNQPQIDISLAVDQLIRDSTESN